MIVAKMPDGTPEIYDAVQGEGLTIGKPVVFCRLSNCNLSCSWCDTFYTWNFKEKYTSEQLAKGVNKHDTVAPVDRSQYQMIMKTEEVADAINKARGGHRGVVFTGGEPTLQQKAIVEVIDLLKKDGEEWYFEIETNGTLMMLEELGQRLNQINSSPKLASSSNEDLLRDRPQAIARLLELSQKYKTGLCFKFVVRMETWEKDLKEIQEWEAKNKIPREHIYLMPEGTTRERITEASRFLNEVAMKQGYKMSTRLQVLLYGEKRAV